MCRPGDLDAKEEVKVAHVLDSKLSLKFGDDVLKKSQRGSRDDHVVDVQEKNRHVLSPTKNEEGGVGSCRCEPNHGDEPGETLVPGAWLLFKPVKAFGQEAHNIRMAWINEAHRLLTVDVLGEIVV